MRLLLYNIQYGTGRLRRFSWLEMLRKTTRHFDYIDRFVKAANPDLIGLVEVDAGSYRSRKRNQADELAKKLGYTQCHRVKYPSQSLGRRLPVLNKQANAVLSRLPLTQTAFHDFTIGFKSLAIRVDTDAFTFFLVHLALGQHARHKQLDELIHLIRAATTPVIVAGDFNTLRGAHEMHHFLKATGLVSANREHHPTFPSWNPKKELDFICHDARIKPLRFRVPHIRISDHLPILLDFEIVSHPARRNDARAENIPNTKEYHDHNPSKCHS